jgi:hypothetical protein
MSSRWTDLETELAGIRAATRNLDSDPFKLAHYVYEVCAAYVGADHQGICEQLIAEALNEVQVAP